MGGEKLCKTIQSRRITKLDIDNNEIEGKILGELMQVVPVRKLHLVRNKITEEQMAPIKANMLATKNLKYIYMGSNQLSNKSLGLLAEGLKQNTGIEELSFTHNSLCLDNGKNFI